MATVVAPGVPVERVILLGLGVFVGISLLVYLVIQVWRILSDAADAWALRRTAYLKAMQPQPPSIPMRPVSGGAGRGKPGLKHRPPPHQQVEEYEEGMEEQGQYEYEGQWTGE